MKVKAFPLLTDQNIHAEVTAFLREVGFDVVDLQQAGLVNSDDATILVFAEMQGRVVVTHDSDFGMLAIQAGASYVGIVHLRPGHISPRVTIDSIRQLIALDIEVTPPFIITAKRSDESVTVRIRSSNP